jgi:hypothetical protein
MGGEITQLFLEDFSKGQTFQGVSRTITKADSPQARRWVARLSVAFAVVRFS